MSRLECIRLILTKLEEQSKCNCGHHALHFATLEEEQSLECSGCHVSSKQRTVEKIVEVPIPPQILKTGKIGLQDLFAKYSVSEITDWNRCKCDHINASVLQTIKFLDKPDYLIINVKRTQTFLVKGKKLAHEWQQVRSNVKIAFNYREEFFGIPYSLIAIGCHIPFTSSPSIGHYISYSLIRGQWWKFDDEHVEKVLKFDIIRNSVSDKATTFLFKSIAFETRLSKGDFLLCNDVWRGSETIENISYGSVKTLEKGWVAEDVLEIRAHQMNRSSTHSLVVPPSIWSLLGTHFIDKGKGKTGGPEKIRKSFEKLGLGPKHMQLLFLCPVNVNGLSLTELYNRPGNRNHYNLVVVDRVQRCVVLYDSLPSSQRKKLANSN